jgi:hypothetical protein
MRRIVQPPTPPPSVKNERGEYVSNKPEAQPPPALDPRVPALNNCDLDGMLDHYIELLKRELRWLYQASLKGKLDRDCARDLVVYAKLAFELRNLERDRLDDMTDAEIEALLRERREARIASGSQSPEEPGDAGVRSDED